MSSPATQIDAEAFTKHHFVLPAMPTVVQQLLDALNSGKSNAGEIADLLSVDAGLVAQIMKIVNSAYFGLPTPIREIKHAVAYLGLGEIKRIALTVAVMDRLAPTDSKEFKQFWCHSFHAALTAKLISKKFDFNVDPEELYVAALLHDVGKLVYMKFFPEQYEKLMLHCRANSSMMIDAEDALNLPSHTLYGAILCERWLFSELVKQACLCHELSDLKTFNSGEVGDDNLLVVCISNLVSNLALHDLANNPRQEICAEVRRALDCDESEFLLLMGELYELKSETQKFLSDL